MVDWPSPAKESDVRTAPADAAAIRRDNGPDRFPTLLGCKAARVHKAFDTLSCRLTSCVQVSHTRKKFCPSFEGPDYNDVVRTGDGSS
jgi:hypothetical protein